ncbi:hypothetical protein [Pseudotabrizicola formosa]|uniref:hypothetical protein n=1 Tax=Pseudotabrizicola formosa TaxID=2030009 RepID=UPI000CD0BDD9|nr:hypothetical protein [Pseudotabrizicola formosa]
MVYTLGEAEQATGKSRSTICAAIKSGRIAARKDATGMFHIDPSELHRIYPRRVYTEHKPASARPPEDSGAEAALREVQARLDAAQARLAEKDSLIADLREDRDRWRQQATALLTGPPPRKRRIFRLFGR